MTVTIKKFERMDSHTDTQDICRGDEIIGEIVKTHSQPAGALSLTDSRGPVESYEVDLESGSRFFLASDYPTARAAHAAAKAYAQTVSVEG